MGSCDMTHREMSKVGDFPVWDLERLARINTYRKLPKVDQDRPDLWSKGTSVPFQGPRIRNIVQEHFLDK